MYIFPTAAAFLFAAQDIMIKKMVDGEHDDFNMLFYFSIVTSLVATGPAIYVWIAPTAFELLLLALYGLMANVMQYLIFRAFSATELTALAPYRYVEFLISAIFGFVFFCEIPGVNTLIGALILITCTLYLAYLENTAPKPPDQPPPGYHHPETSSTTDLLNQPEYHSFSLLFVPLIHDASRLGRQ
jgi:S-adenosylmethionine uptake transporter